MVSGIVLAALAAQSTPDTMPANSWLSVPNTKMRSVAPTNGQFAGTWGTGGPANVIAAWCGAALDTKRSRLVLWGGGHADYYGNELYVFDVPALRWTRLTDPFVNPVMDQEVNADGTPNSRHTYGGLAYIAHADRFLGQAGSLAGVGFARCDRTWTFDFDALKWTNRNPATTSGGGFGCAASYDGASRKLWWGSARTSFAGLWSYDYDANSWAKHNDDNFSEHASALDTKRGLLVFVGNGEVFAYDVRSANYTKQVWPTTGGGSFISKKSVGLDYDSVSDRIVGWHGGAVYALDPATKNWTTTNPSGAPATTSNGIYGRWRYVPSVNAFIVATDWDADVHFYKLTAGGGGGSPPPADTTPPAISITTPTANPTATATATPIALGGTASDDAGVVQITWSNALTGGSGTATGTTSWTASIPLGSGSNAITVTARDAAGNQAADQITVSWTPPASGDSDGDGLPDAWEQQYFMSLAETGGGDPDNDGATNAQEYAAGTDPTDPASVPGGGAAVASSGEGTEGFCGALGAEAFVSLLLAGIHRRRRK
jgi:hypothetical protein